MVEKTVPNEKAIIEEILRRKGTRQQRISSEKMEVFKERLGEEIQSTGSLRHEFVEELLKQLKNGEL